MYRPRLPHVFTFSWLILFAANPTAASDLVVSQDALLTGNVNGDLIITNGATVTARRIRVTGDVIVEDFANFRGEGLQIDGNLLAESAGNVVLRRHILKRPRVLGDILVRHSLGILRLFDVRLEGNLQFEENLPYDIVVLDSFLNADVQFYNNSAERQILFRGNIVWGSFQAFGNEPPPQLAENFIFGPITNGPLLEIRAAGDEGEEIFQLHIDGQLVQQWSVTKQYQTFGYTAASALSADQVRVAFVNDLYVPGQIDRNLHVDYISIDGTVFETEAPNVYSTGTWLPGDGIKPGFRQSETLHANGYFQYGFSGENDEPLVQQLNEVLPDGWSHALYDDGSDVRLRTFDTYGNAFIAARFGSAGVVADLDDTRTGQRLLAPSYQGEITDRVLQWTLWEQGKTVVYDVPSLPYWEDRFNMTQAGTSYNVLHGTAEVELDQSHGRLDVWSVADLLWKLELEPYMDGTIEVLTRNYALDGGALLIRRVMRIGVIKLNGQEVLLANPYFEAWSPFSDGVFNSMALSIDAQGHPDIWFADSQNIPHYPGWPVAQTRGWAMVYDRGNTVNGTALAMVFGRDQGFVHLADGTTADPRRFVLNTMDFPGGLAVLPGLWPNVVPAGSIIDQYFILVPSQGITNDTAAILDALSARLAAPQVYHPGAVLDGELNLIADRLENLASEQRVRTDNLGLLVRP